MFINAEPKLWSSAEYGLKKITTLVMVHLTCSWRRPTSFSLCESKYYSPLWSGRQIFCWNWSMRYYHPSSSLSPSLTGPSAYFFLLPSAAAFWRKLGLAPRIFRGNESWLIGEEKYCCLCGGGDNKVFMRWSVCCCLCQYVEAEGWLDRLGQESCCLVRVDLTAVWKRQLLAGRGDMDCSCRQEEGV